MVRPLSLVVLVLFGGATAAASTEPRPARSEPARSTVLVWGGSLFVARSDFEGWLRAHGESYGSWSAFHPAGRAILAAAAEPVRFRGSQLAPTREIAPARLPVAASPGRASDDAILLGLAAFAVALMVLSALPLVRLAPGSAAAMLVQERRFGISAAALGIFVGVVVAKLVT